GNTWESEPNKNVALSLILRPVFLKPDRQFLLTKIISSAVADLMAELLGSTNKTEEISIKWPNDIYINNKKIAGILIENNLRENVIQSTVVGIGINVNQQTFTSNINATSLCLLTNNEFDPMFVIERLCEFIEARYLQLKANKLDIIEPDYLKRLYRLNEWANFSTAQEQFEGKIIGVSEIGKLQVELKSSEIKEFELKEIKFI
ncbi:MAG: biotin--[acetyl-CoA-carboxylase] ligase, partial [Bacteroidia bacterium]